MNWKEDVPSTTWMSLASGIFSITITTPQQMISFKNEEGHKTLVDINRLLKLVLSRAHALFHCTCCFSSRSPNNSQQEKNSFPTQLRNIPTYFVTILKKQTVLIVCQLLGQTILIIVNFFYNLGTLALIVSFAMTFGHWWISILYFSVILLFHAALLFRSCPILER